MSALSFEEKLRAVSLSPMTQTVKTDLAYQSKDADFTIISADGISFKVHRVVLSLASPVFRDMLSVPSESGTSTMGDSSSTLTLYDSAIENSASLKTFLDFLYLQCVPTISVSTYEAMVGPLKLIQKYDCAGARRVVLYALRSMLLPNEGVTPIYVFILAANLEDVYTCRRAIEASDESIYAVSQHRGGSHLDRTYPEEDTFDIRTMPISMAELIPFRYAFALMRARLIVEKTTKNTNPVTAPYYTTGQPVVLSKEKAKYATQFANLLS